MITALIGLNTMKPILFNSDMVRAILAGKKTQTRRIVKDYLKKDLEIDTDGHTVIGIYNQYDGFVHPILDYAPYMPGDILYVRETWSEIISPGEFEDRIDYVYKATDQYPFGKDGYIVKFRWRPSIHMPKEAARIFLRVTNVRVERLNSITEEEVFKEGYRGCETEHTVYHVDPPEACWNVPDCPLNLDCLRLSFAEMFGADVWDKTIKPGELDRYGWYANPWVWVIEFERIDSEGAEQ